MERLDKIISATGKKSRREVKILVKQGRILVDGAPASAPEMKVDPAVNEILLDGENIGYQRFTYIMLHKPAGVLSAVEDKRQKTVLDLLPEELQGFYIDKFDLSSESGCEQKLSLFGLINMDEFDRYGVRSMATLKNLMQMKKMTFRKSHRSYYSQLPRIASFIGTINQKELLTDTTGMLCSVRSR